VLALVLLAIVSAIVAFDRWPESGSASSVERIAVDRSEARRVETELVRERTTAVVRGVVAVRDGSSATAAGAGDVFLVADRGTGGQSDGGGFGPPPPPVPFAAPGEGGTGLTRFNGSGGGGVVPPEPPPPNNPIQEAACDAQEALGDAGAPLDRACRPGSRRLVRQVLGATTTVVRTATGDGSDVELSR
jgi:hypothetical protein